MWWSSAAKSRSLQHLARKALGVPRLATESVNAPSKYQPADNHDRTTAKLLRACALGTGCTRDRGNGRDGQTDNGE